MPLGYREFFPGSKHLTENTKTPPTLHSRFQKKLVYHAYITSRSAVITTTTKYEDLGSGTDPYFGTSACALIGFGTNKLHTVNKVVEL